MLKTDAKIVIPCHYDLFPDNSLPPRLLRTNMIALGIGDRYRELKYGEVYTYPKPAPDDANSSDLLHPTPYSLSLHRSEPIPERALQAHQCLR